MKKQKRQAIKPAVEAAPAAESWLPPWWTWLIGACALFLAFEAYGPALHSPFVLDDLYLFYTDPNTASIPLLHWLEFQRPVLMFSYWVNYQMGGTDPHVYHTTNVFLHFLV